MQFRADLTLGRKAEGFIDKKEFIIAASCYPLHLMKGKIQVKHPTVPG